MNKPSTPKSGFALLFFVLAGFVVFGSIYGFYLWMNKQSENSLSESAGTTTPTPTSIDIPPFYPSLAESPASLDLSPSQVVQQYYEQYSTCIQQAVTQPSPQSGFERCAKKQENKINSVLLARLGTQRFADPILCAQNSPQAVRADQVSVNNNSAVVLMHETFVEDHVVTVALSKNAHEWQITDITCPQ